MTHKTPFLLGAGLLLSTLSPLSYGAHSPALATTSDQLSVQVLPFFVGQDGHEYVYQEKADIALSRTQNGTAKYATNSPGLAIELKYDTPWTQDTDVSSSLMAGYVHTTGRIVSKGETLAPSRTDIGAQGIVGDNLMSDPNDWARSKLNATLLEADFGAARKFKVGDNDSNHVFGVLAGAKAGYVLHRMRTVYSANSGDPASALSAHVKEDNDVYGGGPKLGASWHYHNNATGVDFATSVASTLFLSHHRIDVDRYQLNAAGVLIAQERGKSTHEALFEVQPVIDFDAHMHFNLNLYSSPISVDLGYRLQDWVDMLLERKAVDDTQENLYIDTRKSFYIHGPYLKFTMAI